MYIQINKYIHIYIYIYIYIHIPVCTLIHLHTPETRRTSPEVDRPRCIQSFKQTEATETKKPKNMHTRIPRSAYRYAKKCNQDTKKY